MSSKEISDAIYSVFPFTCVDVIEDIDVRSTSVNIKWYYKGCGYELNRFIPRDYPKEMVWRLIQTIVEEIARDISAIQGGQNGIKRD